MAKSRREEKGGEGEYEFKLPPFDEAAFIRREVLSARASFYTLGLGALAGVLAVVLDAIPSTPWQVGWIAVLGVMFALRPLLRTAGFPEEVTQPKVLVGSYFMLFFTALGIWILGVNVVPAT